MASNRRRTVRQGQQLGPGGHGVGDDTPRTGGVLLSPLVVFLVYTLLALIITHPLWLHLADAVPGDIGDPLLNTWAIAWDAHAVLTTRIPPAHGGAAGLFDANIFFPLANTLAYSEHLFSTAALVLPLGLVSGQPVAAYNLSLLLSFPLAGLGMYLLVLRWTHRRGAAFLAGLAYAFAPYRLAAVAHLQLLTVQWLPFSVLALDGLLKRQTSNVKNQTPNPRSRAAKYWVLLVVFTTLQVLASWYLAVFALLILGLYTLGWWLSQLRPGSKAANLPILGRVALAALAVAGLTLPFALPYLDVLPQLQAARPVSLAASMAAQPSDFLAAPSYLRVAGPLTRTLAERPGFTEENALYLGIVTSLLALVGLVLGRPRWRTLTLAAILLVSLALTFAGPYLALARALPLLTVVRVPPRWVIPATFALAGLVGLGVSGLVELVDQGIWDRGIRTQAPNSRFPDFLIPRFPDSPIPGSLIPAFLLILGLLLVIEAFAAPLPLAWVGAVEDFPVVYHALRGEALREPGGWGIVELPMHVAPAPEFPETKRMVASTLGWWGLVNGYSGFTPARQMALSRALAEFPGETALRTLEMLGADGVRYLIVHASEAPMDRATWESIHRWEAERGTSLLPIGRFGPDDLYLINPYADELITNPAAVTDPYFSSLVPTPISVRFSSPTSGAEIWLLAYGVTGRLEDWKIGNEVSSDASAPRLTLYWETSAPLDAEYTVFVHSLNAQGELVGQADGPPLANHYPTTAWRPGEIVQDSRLVPFGGRYLVGLYDPVSGERLPAFAADGTRLPDDAVVLFAAER